MSTCRHCKADYEASPWQMATNDYECDDCRKKRQAEYRARRKAEGRPIITRRPPIEKQRAYRARHLAIPENRARRNALVRGYAKKHPERHSARRKLRHEVEMGRIVPLPCEVCGVAPAQGHHASYSLPLAVTWLCAEHHHQLHVQASALVGGELRTTGSEK